MRHYGTQLNAKLSDECKHIYATASKPVLATAEQVEQLYICLDVAHWQEDFERASSILAELSTLEA